MSGSHCGTLPVIKLKIGPPSALAITRGLLPKSSDLCLKEHVQESPVPPGWWFFPGALTCVQRQPALSVCDVVRSVRLLVAHRLVPLGHADSRRPVLGAKVRSRGGRAQPPSPTPDPPAALTLAQTAEVCRARQAQGSARLQASTCGETGSERTPGGAPALPPAAYSPAVPARGRSRTTPFWAGATRQCAAAGRRCLRAGTNGNPGGGRSEARLA